MKAGSPLATPRPDLLPADGATIRPGSRCSLRMLSSPKQVIAKFNPLNPIKIKDIAHDPNQDHEVGGTIKIVTFATNIPLSALPKDLN